MRTFLPASAILSLILCGCPGQAPSADRFAADAAGPAVDAALADAAPADAPPAETGTDAARAPGDAAADVPAADATAADATVADAALAKGICPATGNLGLFAKTLDNGAYDTIHALAATADGGALLVGKTGNGGTQTDVWVARVGALGGLVWGKAYGAAGEEEGRAGLVLADGHFVAGLTRAKGAGLADGWLLRLDVDGNLLWDKAYGGTSVDGFSGIAAAPGGGVVLAGSNRSLGGGLEDGWLLRADSAGEVLWQFKFGGSSIDELYGVVALANGGFAAAGESASGASLGSDAWLLVVDAKGKQVESRLYSQGEHDDARALAVLPGGGFVLTGQASDKGNPSLWTLRTDAAGNLQGKDVVSGNQGEAGRAVAVFADGSFAVAGETDSALPDGGSQGYDGWLLRYDAWGNRLWDKRFGDAGNQWLTGVAALTDGGLLLAGRRFESSSTFDGWLLRTDAWGHATCSGLGPCKSLVAADCDDGKPCSVDRCDSIDGCSHAPLPDGKPCGKGAVCGGSACVGG